MSESELLLDRIMIQNLINLVINRPIPIDKQRSCVEYEDLWISDWWTIEVLKYLYNGEEDYFRFTPSLRIINNKNLILKEIKRDGDIILSTLKCLKEITDKAKEVVIFNVERGLDILPVVVAKKWDKIYCCDSNNEYEFTIQHYFHALCSIDSVEFINTSVENFDFNILKGDTIAIVNFVELKGIDIKPLLKNNKIKHIIKDGKLWKE